MLYLMFSFAAFLTTIHIVHHLYRFVRFKFVDPFLPFKLIVATDRLANPKVDISIRGHNTRIPPSANERLQGVFQPCTFRSVPTPASHLAL